MVDNHDIIEDGIILISSVVELTDQLAEATDTCLAHTKEYHTDVSRLDRLASQRMLLRQEPSEALVHALGLVVSLAA